MSRNIVVVGGSSGIGLELVKELERTGDKVFVLSRTSDQIPPSGNIFHITYDVLTDTFPIEQLPDTIDGLAYCPGSINLKPFRSLKPQAFQKDLEINLLGAVKVLQAVEKSFKKAGAASVVLFSTVAVQQGMPFHASVAAAKGAVEGLTRSLAAEWAPKIRVNCIAPSLTATPMAGRLLSTPEKVKASGDRHPLKRVGTAAEVAGLAAYLLKESSSWISGQIIGIDGGMSSLKV